ncbi:MAG: adenylate/guanylate cyclase domain-containing protein [Limisphaerales bacterium]
MGHSTQKPAVCSKGRGGGEGEEAAEAAHRLGVENIKTIGDCCMSVCGVPVTRADHAASLAGMALDMIAAVQDFNRDRGSALQIRIGLNSGPVVAGVIGRTKFIYDLWGDTVNVASRMESSGQPGRIQVAAPMHPALAAAGFTLEERGGVEVRGKGLMHTWWLIGRTGG